MLVTLTAKLWNDCVAERIAAEDAGVEFDYFGKSPIARLLQEATGQEWCVGRFGVGDEYDTWEAFRHVPSLQEGRPEPGRGYIERRLLSEPAAEWEAWFEMKQDAFIDPVPPETFEVFLQTEEMA